MIKILLEIFVSFSTGVVIAGAIYGFIVAIGIIPRIVYKTDTRQYLLYYETLIIIAAILSSLYTSYQFQIPVGKFGLAYIYFCIGIFVGSLAVCIAEVLSVIPIMVRRVNLFKHITTIMLAIALGKGLGGYIFHTFTINFRK